MNEPVFVEERPEAGREVPATAGAVIGREGTDIVVADAEVSRRHAAIRDHDGGVAIEDLGSTNGTFVNERRIQGLQPLSDGDTVRFGNTTWRLRAPAAAGAGATAVGAAAPAATPEVTAARPVPSDIRPPQGAPAAPQAAPATAPQQAAAQAAPQAPAQPGAPSAEPVGRRGDVPQPLAEAPSAIRRVLPAPQPGQQGPAFTAPPSRSRGGSVATRLEATVVCLLIVLAVAVGVVIYLAAQG